MMGPMPSCLGLLISSRPEMQRTMNPRTSLAPFAAALISACFLQATPVRAAAERIEPADAPRQYVDLDFDWRFTLGDDPAAIHPSFDDAAWRTVRLPHDWSIEGPFGPQHASGTGYAPGGVGWYRKHFGLDPKLKGRRIAIEFDGVYQNAQVWINGHLVGGRPYGYSSFQFDLTPHLHYGDVSSGDNVLAVRVDHDKVADSRWYTGSGIYRDVRLRITDPVAVAHWGTFVTTPTVTADKATVAVETTLDNRDDSSTTPTIRLTVLDAAGAEIVTHTSDASIEAHSAATLKDELAVPTPALWSPDSPTLYTLRTEVLDGDAEKGGNIVDRTETPFGIRTFRFDPDQGFFLNDVNMKLLGVCLHHDAGCLGAAVPPKVLERRLRLMKELGANAIRTSHNPPAPELLDMCDRLGLLVQDEAFDEFTPPKNKWVHGRNVGQPSRFGYGEIFDDWSVRDVQDMVRRDRNHPSIIMWSIGNEIDYPNDPFSHPVLGREYRPTHPRAENLVPLGERLVDAIKDLDQTRYVTAALAKIEMTNAVGFPELLDAVGYNYQEQLYAADHERYPKRVIYGSENDDNYNAWRAVADNDYISGQFLWTGIDYLGEAPEWPQRVFPGGVADMAGFPKPDYFWRQALWTKSEDKPMVYLAATQRPQGERGGNSGRRRNFGFERRGGPPTESWNWNEGAPVRVLCATNCPTVDLVLNGKTVATLTAEDDRQGWRSAEIAYEPGTLEAVARDGERELARHTLRTAGEPHHVQLDADATTLAADGHAAAHVTFTIVDENGVRVPNAEHEVTFEIEGPARFLGIENGATAGDPQYQDNRCPALRGRGLAIVQSTRNEPGTATIRATATGLALAELKIEAQ
jgi:beta-galactosidase